MTKSPKLNARIESLDILRGLDLFLLVFLQPVFMSLAAQSDIPALEPIVRQFNHAEWTGFTLWDLVMPLFMFMAGVSMPFSLNKYIKENGNKGEAYLRIFKRFIILWLLGLLVQGNILAFDPKHIYLYSNTLQAIAAGYLITGLIYLNFNVKGVVYGAVLLFFTYWLGMTLVGDYSPDGNFAIILDRRVLGRFIDGTNYSWIWSSLNFAVTVMLGFLSGQIIRSFSDKRKKVVKILFISGAALTAYGLQQYAGEWYNSILTLGNYLTVFLILWFLYRAKVFLKV